MRSCLLLTGLGLIAGVLSLAAIGADAPKSKSPSQVRLAAKSEWPSWRGPKRDAISTETGLLTEWTEEGPEVLWTADGLGGGYSSISISGGRIYTCAWVGSKQEGKFGGLSSGEM